MNSKFGKNQDYSLRKHILNIKQKGQNYQIKYKFGEIRNFKMNINILKPSNIFRARF